MEIFVPTELPSNAIKLKPCPFCGSDGDDLVMIELSDYYLDTVYAVQCDTCTSRGAYKITKQMAIDEWNERVSNTDLRMEKH